MKKVFHHFSEWEDFRAGMYAQPRTGDGESLVTLALELLTNEKELYVAMSEVTRHWPYSTEENLTDISRNRRAWLGQAACCYRHGTPNCLTKMAWWMLTSQAQDTTNAVAEKVIKEWEGIYNSTGQLVLYA